MSLIALRDLAAATTLERIRAAVGACSPDVDPDVHAELVLARVLEVRVPDLAEDLQAEARRIASRTITDGLQVKGA